MSSGQIIGDYKIVKVLGQGSQGVAFLAEPQSQRQKLGRRVVLKRLEQGAKSSAEMRVMQKMKHPNIIHCVDSFAEENMVYLVLTYAEGGDLEQYIAKCKKENKNIPIPTVVNWFVQMCAALQYCHDNNVVHRDIKPGNIFLTKDNKVLLGDFGVAKMLDRNSIANTMVGSPMCLSPEVISGNKYDAASDVWSLGCILYEMATLAHPFDVDNFGLLITRVCSGQYNKIPSKTPEFLQNAIKGMLTVDVNERWMISDVLNSDEKFRVGASIGGVSDGDAASQKTTSIEGTISLDAWMKLKEKDIRGIEAYIKKFRASDAEIISQIDKRAPARLSSPTTEMNAARAKRMLESPAAKEKQRSQTPPSTKKAFEEDPSPNARIEAEKQREAKRKEQQQALRDAMANGRKAQQKQTKDVAQEKFSTSSEEAVVSKQPSGAKAQERKKSAPTQRVAPQADIFGGGQAQHFSNQYRPSAPHPVQAQRAKDAAKPKELQAGQFAFKEVPKAKEPPVVPQTRPVATGAPPQNPQPVPTNVPSPTAPAPPPERKAQPHERQALKDMIKEQRAKQQGMGVATTGDVNVEIVLPGNLRNLPQNRLS